jgi:hypothetical protein
MSYSNVDIFREKRGSNLKKKLGATNLIKIDKKKWIKKES